MNESIAVLLLSGKTQSFSMILSILLTCVWQTIIPKYQMVRQDNNFVCILYPEILFTKTSLGFNDSSMT